MRYVSPFHYRTQSLDEMEEVLATFYGGTGQVGQRFVVTNRRLLMCPINVSKALDGDADRLDDAAPGAGILLKHVLSKYGPMNPRTVWLRDVVDVRATNNSSLFKAPGLEITTEADEVIKLRIVLSMTTLNRNPKNNGMRDKAVEALNAAVASAKSVSERTV